MLDLNLNVYGNEEKRCIVSLRGITDFNIVKAQIKLKIEKNKT